mmetsp:Transcript_33060/g.48509  ORF Transcript_33060/g.48509 Transcript_33060/m.48509 type:complete len:248 (+) Transcript_33060:515-1258(+)
MAQTLLMPSKKGKEVIEVEHEDSSMSEDSTDMSAFEVPHFKKARLVKKKDAGKGGSKEGDEKKKGGKGVFATSSVLGDTKLLIAKAKKSLKGKTILYPWSNNKTDLDSSLFFIMQQQMKQREDEKAVREQQMHLACMERNATERARKERESQRERRHKDFMMMMIMVTGSKSPIPSISPTPPSNFVTPTQKVAEEDKLEEDIAKETVSHDTVMHMNTPPSPPSTMSKAEKAKVNKIRDIKTFLKNNM